MGMDSLMAVELRNRLKTAIGVSLPTTMAFEYPTIESLADFLISERFLSDSKTLSDAPKSSKDPKPRLVGNKDEASVRIEELSEEEAEAMLLKKLANL
jgi:hypothetical protein